MKLRILPVVGSIGTIAAFSAFHPVAGAQAMRHTVGAVRNAFENPLRHGDGPLLIEFDPPGAASVVSAACGSGCGTQAFGNNDAGAIVGSYTDKNVVPHGFLRSPDGRFTAFDAPGAGLGAGLDEGTVPYAISNLGSIVGQFQDPKLVFHGFVRNPDGSFDTFSAAGAGTGPFQGTLAFDINGAGDTAGIYADGSNVIHGFVRTRSHEIIAFDPPGSVYTYVCEETCLSRAGVAGFYHDKSGVFHGFVRDPSGASVVFNVPYAGKGPGQGTAAFSINACGTITGVLVDANSVQRGFSRSAGGAIVEFEAPGSGTSPGQGTRPSTNNRDGSVAGWFIDKTGLNHGFVWVPPGAR